MGSTVGFRKVFVTVPVAGVAVKLSQASIKVHEFEMYVPLGNTGSVYLGDSSVENSSGVNGGWIPRTKGEVISFTASENASLSSGDYFDLSKLYLNANTNSDSAIIQYKVPEA
jgi:hypothetical protein